MRSDGVRAAAQHHCICPDGPATVLKVMLDGLKRLGDPEIDAITEDQARLG